MNDADLILASPIKARNTSQGETDALVQKFSRQLQQLSQEVSEFQLWVRINQSRCVHLSM